MDLKLLPKSFIDRINIIVVGNYICSMNFNLRTALIGDGESIYGLSSELSHEFLRDDFDKSLFNILDNPDHCLILISIEDIIVGWIHGIKSMRIQSEPFIEIGGMVVEKTHRRKGLGRMLFLEILSWAKKSSIEKIRVRCNVNRLETHDFYRHLNFIEIKSQNVFDFKI